MTGQPRYGHARCSGACNAAQSAYVSKLMMDGFAADYTVHIGDVYLQGTVDEVCSVCAHGPVSEGWLTWRHRLLRTAWVFRPRAC